MASVYDIARIAAGDPMEQQRGASREAAANIEQYKHQKDIIEEINKAMKEAEKKAKKGKGKFGMLGSLAGGLLGLIPGVGAPGAALLSGLLSGGAEKLRQKKYDPVGALEAVQKKYKGRKEAKQLDPVIEELEAGLDKAFTTDALISGAKSLAIP